MGLLHIMGLCIPVGGKTSEWRASLRVYEPHGHPKLKDWVETRCKSPDAGCHRAHLPFHTLLQIPGQLFPLLRDPVSLLKHCVGLTGHPGVGSRLCVFWPTERNWNSGQVTAFDASEGLSQIKYHDGDVEWLHLAVECYMQQPTGGFTASMLSVIHYARNPCSLGERCDASLCSPSCVVAKPRSCNLHKAIVGLLGFGWL